MRTVLQNLRNAAVIEYVHLDARANQLRRDVGLQIGKSQHQVRS